MRHPALLVLAVTISAPGATAQEPDSYPWHNRVAPTVTATVTLHPQTPDFVYRYSVSNGATAEQRINLVRLATPVPASLAASPADWGVMYDPLQPGVLWFADGAALPGWQPTSEGDISSKVSEIAPGGQLEGFELHTPCGPGGAVTWYAQGYNHMPVYSEYVAVGGEPTTWEQDAVVGTVAGPGDCGVVQEWGNRRPATDGFLGVVNFQNGAVFASREAVVQLRFSRAGEQVHAGTFRAELNQQDVTAAFRTNSRGDVVSVFAPGTSPVQVGRNVLLLSVDGVMPGSGRTATDTDRISFTRP